MRDKKLLRYCTMMVSLQQLGGGKRMAFRQAVWGEHRSTERAEHAPVASRRTRCHDKVLAQIRGGAMSAVHS
jgi:hypothetical protein